MISKRALAMSLLLFIPGSCSDPQPHAAEPVAVQPARKAATETRTAPATPTVSAKPAVATPQLQGGGFASAQTPIAQTPIAQTPIAQTPIAQTPIAQTPIAQTPIAQTPIAQTPVAPSPIPPNSSLAMAAVAQPPVPAKAAPLLPPTVGSLSAEQVAAIQAAERAATAAAPVTAPAPAAPIPVERVIPLVAADFIDLSGRLAHLAARWAESRPSPGAATDPVTLQSPGREDIRKTPELALGMGTIRYALSDLIESDAPELVDRETRRSDALRFAFAANKLLGPLLGGALFDPKRPGALRLAAVKKLSALLRTIRPETRIAGVTARDVYALYRRPIREYAAVYRALQTTPGRRRAVRAYRMAVKKLANPDLIYNSKMIDWYSKFAHKHDVGNKAGLGRRWDVSIIAGFWLRRMADGTDKLLWELVEDRLQAFDPNLLKEIR